MKFKTAKMDKNFKDKIIAYIHNNVLIQSDAISKSDEGVAISDDIGMRVYRDTLAFLFEVATNNIFKFKKNLKIISSIGDGYYFLFKDGIESSEDDVVKISKEMRKLVAEKTKIETTVLDYFSALKILESHNMSWSCDVIKSLGIVKVPLYKCCDTYALCVNFFAKDFSDITLFELRKYHNGFLLRFPRRGFDEILKDWKDNKAYFDAISDDVRNTDILSIDSIGQLNDIVSRNGIQEYIEISERYQRRKIIEVADKIHNKKKIKAVFVAGPSSSNKTTFANKLCLELKVLGYQPLQISLDDYYFTKDKVPKDEFGKPDVECLESIDVDLFRKNLIDLYEGKDVFLPHFEFNFNKIGRRSFASSPINLSKNNILVIEGIHGLNEKLTQNIDKNAIFKIYISPITQINLDEYNRIRSTDIRILRRLVRDFRKRNASAQETLSMWPAVERGERKYIFPFQNDADAVFNSAHSYEIGVLAVYAIPLLRSVKPEDGHYVFLTAQRLLRLLSNVNPIVPSLVPETSMLWEFIG